MLMMEPKGWRARALRPDVILTDVRMPVMDGLLMARHLSQDVVTDDIPVIFLTASAMPGDISRQDELGVEVITKPFDPLAIEAQILDILHARTTLLDGTPPGHRRIHNAEEV